MSSQTSTHPACLRTSCAFTLVEALIAVGVASLVLAMTMGVYLFGLRSFAAMGNYAQMSGKSRLALDVMSRDIRQATSLLACTTNLPVKSFTLATYDGNTPCTVTYSWDSNARVATCSRTINGQTTLSTNLTGCDSWNFFLYQRTPTNNYVFYPTTNLTICKLINLSWKCSRTILGKKINTEDMMTAEVVLRNLNVPLSN